MICCLKTCGEDSGPYILCESHRKRFRILSVSQKALAYRTLHEIVRDAHDDGTGMIECFHCGGMFPRNEICGDHFPLTKGSHPEVKWRPDRCVPSDGPCNSGVTGKRKDPNEYMYLLDDPFTPTPDA